MATETPRLATSLDDLRVGQIVIFVPDDMTAEDPIIAGAVSIVEESSATIADRWSAFDSECKDGEWLILKDVPVEPVKVPSELIDDLRHYTTESWQQQGVVLSEAGARELLNTVREIIKAVDEND